MGNLWYRSITYIGTFVLTNLLKLILRHMDRRKFLKTSMLGVGATMMAGAPELMAKDKVERKPVRLEANGWIKAPATEVPVVAEADIVVLGGGPAGVAAAVSAARTGVKVILLERYTFLGGLWTGGLVLPMLSTYGLSPDQEWTKVIWGFSNEIYMRLKKMKMVVNAKAPCVDPEACKYVLEQYCEESGVQIIYHSWASDAVMSGDRIDAIFLETKSGRIAVRGKYFVDASGDGDLIAWSGEDHYELKYHIGAMYRIGGVPDDMKKAGAKTPISGVRSRHIHGFDDQDGLDVLNLSRIQMELRKDMWKRTQELRSREGGEGIYLLETPPQIGVRVTRVLNPVKPVTLEESMHYTSYKDSIGMSGGSAPIMYQGRKVMTKERPYWQIPYSSITPKTCPNLLVGGRCFGYDRELSYDAREIGTCLVTGQAAGTASALAYLARTSVRDVDIEKLRKTLLDNKVKLD